MRSVNYKGYQVFENGDIKSIRYKRVLKMKLTRRGYHSFVMYYDNKRNWVSLHRILAMCFIPNPDNKPCINHKNGIKTDNRLENLEWCTHSENVLHALKNGLFVKRTGVENKTHIQVLQYDKTGVFIAKYKSFKEAHEITGVTISNMYSMISGKTKLAGGFIWCKLV